MAFSTACDRVALTMGQGPTPNGLQRTARSVKRHLVQTELLIIPVNSGHS